MYLLADLLAVTQFAGLLALQVTADCLQRHLRSLEPTLAHIHCHFRMRLVASIAEPLQLCSWQTTTIGPHPALSSVYRIR